MVKSKNLQDKNKLQINEEELVRLNSIDEHKKLLTAIGKL